MIARLLRRALPAGVALALMPAIAQAHPLGNFTINHFAAIHVSPDRVLVDLVIDRAEIPAFQEIARLDREGDGALSAAEAEAARGEGCQNLVADVSLWVAHRPVELQIIGAGVTLADGAGGLSTMRLVCELEGFPAGPIAGVTTTQFEDRSYPDRIGWREIVAVGNGVHVIGAAPDPAGGAARLTAYPEDLLAQPPDVRSLTFTVEPGGVAGPRWDAPDAEPLAAGDGALDPVEVSGGVRGGIAEDLAALVDVDELSPLALVASLLVAIGLGVVHAVSPGHGKTIMAAYLIGGRGTAGQALGLGLAVAVSHTAGVLVLALLTIAAGGFVPPERLYPILAVVSGGLVVGIGAHLLRSRLRALVTARQDAEAWADGDHAPHGGRPLGHDHGHAHGDHGHAHNDHGHSHAHDHERGLRQVSWRGLIALGLSGGLVPSASALILLLGSIAAGRVAYGLVLVLGFGFGMAIVLAGLGLLVLRAGRLVERGFSSTMDRYLPAAQVAFASVVVVLGLVFTGGAVASLV